MSYFELLMLPDTYVLSTQPTLFVNHIPIGNPLSTPERIPDSNRLTVDKKVTF